MEKISIKTTGVNIFKPITNKQATKHTNPFGLSFKGNVIQADVFDSSKAHKSENKSVISKISDKSRAFKSALVGGINNFNNQLSSRFNNGINKIVSFGKHIGNTTKDLIKKANETNIVFDLSGITKHINGISLSHNQYEVKNLVKRPVSELEDMLNKELEARKA